MPKFDYQKAKNDGYNDDEIYNFLNQKKSQGVDLYIDQNEYAQTQQGIEQQKQVQEDMQIQEKGLFGKIGESLKKRGQDIYKTMQETATGEISPPETGVRVVGDIIGGATDIAMGAGEAAIKGDAKLISAITPDVIEEKVKGVGLDILDSPIGQAGINALKGGMEIYEDWKNKNPRIAESLEGILNIASIFPIAKGGQAGIKAVKPIIKTGEKIIGETIAKTGEKMAVNEAKNALKLTTEELKNINSKKLSWLSKDALSEVGTKGGILSEKTYKMPQKLEDLSIEFKEILKGKPEEILKNSKNLGEDLKNQTLNLFKGSKRAMNQKEVLKTIKKAIEENVNIIYESPTQMKQTSEKAMKILANEVKTGTNKGLEQARMNWYAISKNASGKLSEANKVINKVLKETIKKTLPAEKQILYDFLKTKMAKNFDIREIIKAKIKTEVGKSTLKKVVNKLKVPAATIGAYEGAKKLITGKW